MSRLLLRETKSGVKRREEKGAAMKLLVALLCFVLVPGVSVAVQVTDHNFCCRDLPQIHLDQSSEHEFSVGEDMRARVTEDIVDVRWPFKMEGRTIQLLDCVDFSYKKDFTLQNGRAEQNISLFHRSLCGVSPIQASAPPRGSSSGLVWALLVLGCALWLL